MKNGYEILSPYFMKLAGCCVSVYLCIISIKLFVLNPENAYWRTNAFIVWPIILAAFFLCACFFMFVFMKLDNSRIYLFNLYLLCYIKCVLFLLKFILRLHTFSDANMMLKIVLCFAFLFIFLEFLHAQTSRNFIGEKTTLAGTMGIISCIMTLLLTVFQLFFLSYYLLYAMCIFIIFLHGKKVRSSILFQCFLIVVIILLSLLEAIGYSSPSISHYMVYIVLLEVFAVFGCVQIIQLKYKQAPVNDKANPLQKLTALISSKFNCTKSSVSYSNDLQPETFPIIKGVFMLTARFTYFALLARLLTITIWSG